MKGIGNIFKKDLVLGIKDIFVILEVIFAIAFVVVLLFVIPEDITRDATIYICDETGVLKGFIDRAVGLDDLEEQEGEFFVDTRDDLIEGMREEKTAMGIIITAAEGGGYNTEFLTQPYTTEAMIRYVEMEMEDLLSLITPPYNFYPRGVIESVRIEALQYGLRDEIPFNRRLMPPVLLIIVGIIGLFVMISMIGQERVEGTLRAYRVTPSGLWLFITSKHLLLLAIGFTTFSIIYLPMLGVHGYLPSLLITMLTVIFGSSVGVILGSIFDTPMAAVLWVFVLMLVLALPSISYFAPVFSPDWLKFIPSYHTLFGLDAAMFPDNNSHIIRQSVLVLGCLALTSLLISNWVFRTKIGKEA